MRTIHLDLLNKRAAPAVGAWVTAAMAFAFLAAVGAWLSDSQPGFEREVSQRTKELQRLRTDAKNIRDAGKMLLTDDAKEELKKASAMLDHLNTPWMRFLEGLERQFDKPVALIDIATNDLGREYAIVAEAKTFQAMLDYVSALQDSAIMSSVELHHHQVSEKDRDRPVRFKLTGKWAGGS